MQDKANSILINASRMDEEFDGIATGLSNCLTRDGQTTLAADIPFAGRKITGYGSSSAPSARTDVPSWAAVQDGTANYAVAGGSADALTLTVTPAITAYAAGQVFTARLTATNTSATPTLAVSGLPAKTITRLGGNPIEAGDLVAGAAAQFAYNANTDKQEVISPLAASTGTGAAVRATSPTLTTPNLGVASATSLTFGGGALSAYVADTAFTPGISFGGGTTGITYSAQDGKYSRIGNIVFFRLQVTLSSKGSSTGSALITGLPLAAANDTRSTSCAVARVSGINLDTAGGYYTVSARVNANSTTIQLEENGDNVTNADLTDADLSNASSINLAGFYFA